MNEYVIERGVQIPNKCGGCGPKYPFKDMKVGDSFAVPIKERGRVQGAASTFATRHNLKFTTRRLGDVVRIWRIR